MKQISATTTIKILVSYIIIIGISLKTSRPHDARYFSKFLPAPTFMSHSSDENKICMIGFVIRRSICNINYKTENGSFVNQSHFEFLFNLLPTVSDSLFFASSHTTPKCHQETIGKFPT
jgi:hypothetical protein